MNDPAKVEGCGMGVCSVAQEGRASVGVSVGPVVVLLMVVVVVEGWGWCLV